jgi:cbb3-type cytochrome oxidase maturation protein
MSILFVLIPLSLALVACAAWAFFWAVDSGQFDQLDAPAWDILNDETDQHRGRRAP